jgi:hypothetical protein
MYLDTCYFAEMAGRKPNRSKSDKIQPVLHPQATEQLDYLATLGPYGATKTEVARYLIYRGLDDLIRANVVQVRKS